MKIIIVGLVLIQWLIMSMNFRTLRKLSGIMSGKAFVQFSMSYVQTVVAGWTMVAGGGLVRYAIESDIDATGFEEGWAADMGRLSGIPILRSSELEDYAGSFDFISAIEVFEHIPKPVDALLQIRKLLKPGGILFITTGNAQPWRQKFLDWSYTKCPDVHISFYEPETLARCMRMAGFQPKEFRSLNGFVDIIKFKVLKTLRIKNQSTLIDALPWGLIARLVDARHKVSRQPYGIAIED